MLHFGTEVLIKVKNEKKKGKNCSKKSLFSTCGTHSMAWPNKKEIRLQRPKTKREML